MNNLYSTANNRIIVERKRSINEFIRGVSQGIPITLGYIPVSFTFGLMAVNGGIPVWMAILISLTNLTSAGQFVGTGLIIADASLFEITVATFVINIRYMLMSLSLSQKIASGMPLLKRCIMAFGITDEIFTVASLEKQEITFAYMMGLTVCPYFGWALGTALGAKITSVLPEALQSSMGIALYAMFIALIVPSTKKSKATLIVVITAVLMSSALKLIPYIKLISEGWSIIITTIVAAAIGAVFFPRKDD
ncbi:AzlC family ABC transporter permease [Proteiniborus sp.]|uniref:AzlC family ABC transporter permease n=1 Tax=Proteiniborus sp. TaxID=2079015 RepID=UPI00331FCEEF